MMEDDRIAKLEALLARVRSRTRPPDADGNGDGDANVKPLALSAPRSPLDMPTPHAAFRPSPVPPPPSQPIAPMRPKHTSRPEVPAFSLGTPESSQVRPLEPPPMEVVELEVDPDPSIPPPPISGPPSWSSAGTSWGPAEDFASLRPEGASGPTPIEEPLQSRSRLVSAPPTPMEPLGAGDERDARDEGDGRATSVGEEPAGQRVPSDPTIEVAAAEMSNAELEELEADRAPTSSRRPISMEEKMSELDDDVVPLHSPPPASGKLPAASPSIELEELRAQQSHSAPRHGGPELELEAERAELPAHEEVPLFVGSPRRDLTAATFGELLDDALSI